MSFFEPPPPGAEPERPPAPPWMQPPEDELGVAVPLRLVLARTPAIAIAISGLGVYSTGFELTTRVRSRGGEVPGGMSAIRPGLGGWLRQGAPLPDDQLRFGLQYSDGRKGTSLDRPHAAMPRRVQEGKQPELPAGPIVMQRGGSGGGRVFDWQWWIWPLPPPGPVTMACEWPGAGITLTTYELDARLLLDAAANVERLWPSDAES